VNFVEFISSLTHTYTNNLLTFTYILYRGVDKSLARPTSRFILFDGENISFYTSLVIYINSTYSSVAVACFLQHPCNSNMFRYSVLPQWSFQYAKVTRNW